MNLPTFCDACKARVEWHVTAAGKSMPIDPDPHPDGNFHFGPGLRLVAGKPRVTFKATRLYRCHWDTCPKGNEASKRGLRSALPDRIDCDRWECPRDPYDGHLHCFRCGSTEHLRPDCPDIDS